MLSLILLLVLHANPSPSGHYQPQVTVQEFIIPCAVKDGPKSTKDGLLTKVLDCDENGRVFRRYLPRSAYRFHSDCKTVNLTRTPEGKLYFAAQQSCHVIGTQEKIAECEKYYADQDHVKGYDAARDPNYWRPNCRNWWLNAEGDQLLEPVHLMRPLPKTDKECQAEGWNAYLDGATLKQNPYSEESDLRLSQHWRTGWIQAQGRFEKRRK